MSAPKATAQTAGSPEAESLKIKHPLAVNEADLEAIDDFSVESAQLSRNIKSNEQQLLIQALRQEADVVINEELLVQANGL